MFCSGILPPTLRMARIPATADAPCARERSRIDGDKVTRNLAYYTIAHASKFVRPGSVRIASSDPGTLPNVAFKTPEGKKVLIVANDSAVSRQFSVRYRGKIFDSVLSAGSVATYLW